MGQKGAMWNGTEGGYAERDRRGICRVGQKGAKGNGTEWGYAEWHKRGFRR